MATATCSEPRVALRLPPRWTQLRPHPQQELIWTSDKRFKIIVAGARSGKSENVKRWAALRAILHPIEHPETPIGRYLFSAPTQDQATHLFLDELEAFLPPVLVRSVKRSSPPEFRLIHGTTIRIVGLDRPMRSEGEPWHGIVVDEFSECRADVMRYLRPMVSTEGQEGWLILLSRPRGARHMQELFEAAYGKEDWLPLHWTSESILSADEIKSAKADLDELEYRSEYLAEFVTYAGRAYHQFEPAVHVVPDIAYNPGRDLVFSFDFNVDPGVASVCQEAELTRAIGEVFIPRNSRTEIVCNRLVNDWGHHKGKVYVYGDATGGGRHSATARDVRSDWAIVQDILERAFPGRVYFRVPKANPRERARVNAVNWRLRDATGAVGLKLSARGCPNLIRDLSQTMLLEGGSGEIDKGSDPKVSHLSDSLGYFIVQEFPVGGRAKARSEVY
ncbi:MAG: hypothetical protein JXQ29_18695 [Planctomycetes bacterium]|nr:hypothetical protein [Planctomycetota bacterium]